MIGAAGARRLAAGVRAGPGPRCPAVAAARPMSERSGARRPARSTRATSSARLREAGLRARHNLSQNFLADVGHPRGDPARGRPRARPGRAGDRAGPRVPDRRAARGRGGASRPSSSIAGLVGVLRETFAAEPRRPARCGSWRATRSTRTSCTGPAALRRRRQPPVPHHQPDPAPAAGPAAPPGAARPHGPARGRGAGRRAPPGEMSYLLRVLPVPRPGAGRVPGAARRPSSPRPRWSRRSSCWSPTPPTTGWMPRRRTTSGASSRPASASGARCSTTCSTRQLPIEPERVDAALEAAGIARDRRPQTVAVGEWLALAEALGDIPEGR